MIGLNLKRFEALKKGAEPNKWDYLMLLRKPNDKVKVKTIKDLTFEEFVDCENYIRNEQFSNFCSIFAKSKVYFHNLESVIRRYAEQKAELIQEYEFIFNPPIYGNPAPETIGSELRKEFVESFGIYVVLMDVVQAWDGTGYKAIEKWKLSEFMFWANYLRGQKIVENVK